MLEAHDEGYDATPKRIGVVHQLSEQNDFFELNHDVLHAHAHLQFHAIPATVDPRTLLSAEDAGGATASSGGGGGADGGGGGGGGGSQYVSANEALPTFHALLLIIDDKSLLHHFAFHAPMPCVSLLHALYPLADLYFIGRHLFDLRARAAGASEAPSTAFTMETFAPERLIYLGGHNAYARIIPQQVFFRHFIMDGLLYTPKYWTQQMLVNNTCYDFAEAEEQFACDSTIFYMHHGDDDHAAVEKAFRNVPHHAQFKPHLRMHTSRRKCITRASCTRCCTLCARQRKCSTRASSTTATMIRGAC